jgi:hypothetical protein
MNILKARISAHVNWNLPALQINPGDGKLTEIMVGFDPLYLASTSMSDLDPIRFMFTPQYQERLRYYQISDKTLQNLPQGQFGFCLAWNVFDNLEYSVVRQYLTNMYELLQDGGCILFSYNRSIHDLLVADLDILNYEILNIVEDSSIISWIEVKKEGKLISNRAGQTLASIVNI